MSVVTRRPPATSPARSGPKSAPSARRRSLLGLALAVPGVLGASVAARSANARASLDLTRDEDLLQALMKMRGTLGPELQVGWLRARRFAVSDGIIEPLCGLLSATYSYFRRRSEQLFEVTSLEIAHYTDFETGALLQSLRMPFTGATVEVPAYRFGPTKTRFAVKLSEKTPYTPAAGTTEDAFAPAGSVLMTKSIHREGTRGGVVYLRHEEYGRVFTEGSSKPAMFYKESTTWSGPESQVLDPAVRQVDALVAYSAMTSWRPWMQMGATPGHTASNGFGGRAVSLSDLPDDYAGYTKLRHPDVHRDPEAVLAAFENASSG